MTTEEKLEKALDLLERASEMFEDRSPDPRWFKELFLLTGRHMICTEEGWEPGECKDHVVEQYGADYIEDEVNAPEIA
jgi:hypothetical protein